MKSSSVAQIIPLLRLKRDLHFFDYSVPDKFKNLIKAGQLVEIPFRNKNIKGVILDLVTNSKFKSEKLKSINKIIDPLPFLATWQLKLIKEMSKYYFVSMAVILRMILPDIPKKIKALKIMPKYDFKVISKEPNQEINQYYQAKNSVLLKYNKFEDKIGLYLSLIKKVLEKKSQILIVTPLIADAQKIYQYLGQFTDQTSLFLNNLPHNQYWQEWLKIKKGQAKIIIGTRSAIFAPFKNLDLIIIDDEDNENHKQGEPNPRYNVKEVAMKLKEILNVKIIFTALTPSINSLYQIDQKKWQYFEIPKINEWPQLKIIDQQSEFKKGNYSIFSEELTHRVNYNLKRAIKSFLFLNRKGLATLTSCKDCGYLAVCPNCHLPLTYHQSKELICHHCGYKEALFLFCPKCHGPNIKLTGTGTEKVELEAKKIFPQARVVKIDIDTPHTGDLKDAEIIIGTQYALDHINWSEIDLIGVINADTLLYLPDYRSSERTYNLLNKLILFLDNKQKEILIQTFSPQNYVFESLKDLVKSSFFNKEIEERTALKYPPIAKLIKLIYQSVEFNYGQSEIDKVYKDLVAKIKNPEIIINPPNLAYTQQVRGRFRWQIIIKLLSDKGNLDFLDTLPENIIIDRDPESLL